MLLETKNHLHKSVGGYSPKGEVKIKALEEAGGDMGTAPLYSQRGRSRS
jgi:hypothetical protein